jgi:hypothetical protein
MNGTLEIPQKEIKFELNNVTYNQFRIIGERPCEPADINPMMVEKFVVGDPIVLITSNMPHDLKNEIIELIQRYCNI